MVTRIRYIPHNKRENVLESIQILSSSTTGAKYKVRLDLNNYIYEIKNLNSNLIYKGGDKVNNLNVLKRKVRNRLEKLGVQLHSEKRSRTFGVCDKGYTQQTHMEKKYEGLRGITGTEC